MQLMHKGQIIFVADDEDISKDWSVLSKASLVFMIRNDGRFMVIKDRYADYLPSTVIEASDVERLIQQFVGFESSTMLLKDLVKDNKGLNFLGISARVNL